MAAPGGRPSVQPPVTPAGGAATVRIGEKSLEDRVAGLEAQLKRLQDPQYLKNLQEKAFDPRGGEPRVIDAAGNTLPFVGSIQFKNATATVDAQTQRVIVTPSGGGGSGMAANFSDDLVTTDDERAKWAAESGPAVNHLVIDTLTSGTTRIAEMICAEDTAAPGSFGVLALEADDTAGIGVANLASTATAFAETIVQSSIGADLCQLSEGISPTGSTFQGLATSAAGVTTANLQAAGGGTSASGCSASSTTADALANVLAQSALGTASVAANAPAAGRVRATAAAGAFVGSLLDDTGASAFPHVAPDSTTSPLTGGTAVVRGIYGPFAAAPGALAAGASTTVTVNNVFPVGHEATTALVGAVQGAAGSEAVVWSYAIAAPNAILSFTNLGGASHTVTLEFYSISDA